LKRSVLHGLALVVSLALALSSHSAEAVGQDESAMKRRQQGILTGMPFMANITPRTFVDDTGRKLYLAKAPTRVVSLAPSITEMLFALGLDEHVVAVTEFCDYPAAALSKQRISYAHPNLEALVALRPDLILAPRDFLRADILTKLEELKIPAFLLDARTVEDILAHITTLGRIFDRASASHALTGRMRERLADIGRRVSTGEKKRVLYVLNSQPLITVGPGSYLHQLIGLAGGVNIAAGAAAPYPKLSLETVLKEDPEVLIFPVGRVESVPKNEQQEWQRWPTLSAVRDGRLHEVSSDALNRPGPRVVEGLEDLARAIHPEAFSSVGSSQR
jgi:iron complex transport system substrate-binding protein